MNLVSKIESHGVKLQAEGDSLALLGAVDKLTPKQLDYIKAHKGLLLDEIKRGREHAWDEAVIEAIKQECNPSPAPTADLCHLR